MAVTAVCGYVLCPARMEGVSLVIFLWSKGDFSCFVFAVGFEVRNSAAQGTPSVEDMLFFTSHWGHPAAQGFLSPSARHSAQPTCSAADK